MQNIKDEIPNPILNFVLRKKWNALPPKYREALPLPAKRLIFAFTETKKCLKKDECVRAVQQIQKDYMDRGMPDLPFRYGMSSVFAEYDFLIGGDLRIYEGRGWGIKIRRPDIKDWYDDRVVFGYIGGSKDSDKLMQKMIEKSYELMSHGIDNSYLVNFEQYMPGGQLVDVDVENLDVEPDSAK